jgi:hypothetical protein
VVALYTDADSRPEAVLLITGAGLSAADFRADDFLL